MWNKIFILILSFNLIRAECPSMDKVPVMYDSDTFLCGVFFSGEGRGYPIDGCNKCRPDDNENGYLLKHGYNYDAGDGKFIPMGSVIIRPGCKLYGYTVRIASAKLPISSFSINNITEKSRLVLAFNSLKIGSIHSLTTFQQTKIS